MSENKGFKDSGVLTYSGCLVGLNFGQPNIEDIAVQCMRQCRFAGALKEWWPVGMHQMLTADIVDMVLGHTELVLDCLLHDAPEAVFGDTPTPVKTEERREHEHRLQYRIYQSLNITLPTSDQHVIIKEADTLALIAEAAELGPPAFSMMIEDLKWSIRSGMDERIHSQRIMAELYRTFSALDALKAGGRHVADYRNRVFAEISHRHSG